MEGFEKPLGLFHIKPDPIIFDDHFHPTLLLLAAVHLHQGSFFRLVELQRIADQVQQQLVHLHWVGVDPRNFSFPKF